MSDDNIIEKTLLTQKELQEYRGAKYRVVTITPLVENPIKSVRILNQEGLDDLLEYYEEYGEFLVEITKIKS